MEYIILIYFWINSLIVSYFHNVEFLPTMNKIEKWFVAIVFLLLAVPIGLFVLIYTLITYIWSDTQIGFYFKLWTGKYNNLSEDKLEFLNKSEITTERYKRQRSIINERNKYIRWDELKNKNLGEKLTKW